MEMTSLIISWEIKFVNTNINVYKLFVMNYLLSFVFTFDPCPQ